MVAGLLALASCSAPALGQGDWFARYEVRAAATQVNQPHWATPLITGNARVEQGLRADFIRQTTHAGPSTWNDGGSKGLQVIPFPRTELRFSPPPFFDHQYPKALDGFGDVAFRAKFRAYGSNEEHHNAIVSLLLSATVPTGKQSNGSCCAVLTPSVEAGKGFGPLALTTSLAGVLPVSGTAKLGRSIQWNNVAQYRTLRLAWLQVETNTTYYFGGSNDGQQQTFITPGVVVARMPLKRKSAELPGGLTLTLGAGEQMALTHFNTYERATVLTGRFRF